MEDPVPAELQEGFRTIRQHTTTPIAVGEVFDSVYDCYRLIQEQLIDYIRASIVHAGGLTHLRKMATLAELYHVRTGCHGASDLSPVTMAAALHFDLSVHNFGIQEHMGRTPRRPIACSRTPTRSGMGRCTRATSRAWAWTSTKRSPRRTLTSGPTCRSPGWRTERSIAGSVGILTRLRALEAPAARARRGVGARERVGVGPREH